MRYFKVFFSALLAIFIATIAIWSGLIIVLASTIAAPIAAWWMGKRVEKSISDPISEKDSQATEVSYKIIEGEYKVIDK